MDPVTLATLVMAQLTPYIAKAGEEFASKVGDAAFEQGKRLYEALHARFAKEAPKDGGKASQKLEELKEDPDVKATVETKLARILEADPDFANTLKQILQSGPAGPIQDMDFADDVTVTDTHMDTEQDKSLQKMKGGKGSKFNNVTMNARRKGSRKDEFGEE